MSVSSPPRGLHTSYYTLRFGERKREKHLYLQSTDVTRRLGAFSFLLRKTELGSGISYILSPLDTILGVGWGRRGSHSNPRLLDPERAKSTETEGRPQLTASYPLSFPRTALPIVYTETPFHRHSGHSTGMLAQSHAHLAGPASHLLHSHSSHHSAPRS